MSENERKISPAYYGLVLFLAFQLFTPQAYLPILDKVKAHYLIFIVTFILAMFGGLSYTKSKQTFLLLVIFAITLLSILVAPFSNQGNWKERLIEFVQSIAMYLLVTMTLRSGKEMRRFIYTIIVLFFTMGIVSLITFRLGIPPIVGEIKYFGWGRLTNFFGVFGSDANFFGSSFILVFPLSVFIIQKTDSKFIKVFLLFVSFVFLLCILETKSRGALIGLLAVILLLVWENRKRKRFLISVILIVILAAISVGPKFWERAHALRSIEAAQEEGTASLRLRQYGYAF
ncbi:MAG: O-antigen ligase family protein, partial [Candidatus Heimdallarchaeota archaeon]